MMTVKSKDGANRRGRVLSSHAYIDVNLNAQILLRSAIHALDMPFEREQAGNAMYFADHTKCCVG
jgi:hypothetical protein